MAAIRLRPVVPAGWWYDGLLAAGLGALTFALARGHLLDLDIAVRDWVDAHRPGPAYWVARVLNFLGQGGLVLLPVSSALAAAVIWRSRRLWPALLVVVALLLTGATIGPMKFWADRGYPHNFVLAHPEELFSDPVGGTAYPSGHVANAIVWYGVIALLLRALREAGGGPAGGWWERPLRVLPPALVFVCTTYLGFHWITDSVAGLLLGLLLDRLLSRVPWQDLPLPDLKGGSSEARVGS